MGLNTLGDQAARVVAPLGVVRFTAMPRLPADREEWFSCVVYFLLGSLGIAGMIAHDAVPTVVAAMLSIGHVVRDYLARFWPFGSRTGKRPAWPWWTDWVATVLGLLLLRAAYRLVEPGRAELVAKMATMLGEQPRSQLPETSLFSLMGLMLVVAHGRQIVTRDGNYYDWMDPRSLWHTNAAAPISDTHLE